MMIEDIVDNFDKLNSHFDLKLYESNKCFRGRCPIHGGDNRSSVSIYKSGHTSPGNWKCFTNNCHEKYGGSIIGFIRGILSAKNNREYSKQETIEWCEGFFGAKYHRPEFNIDTKLTSFINRSQIEESVSFKLTPDEFLAKLEHPTYFVNRGFKPETLHEFKIGYCNNQSKPFYERVLVPQFDKDGYVIGCLGRSVHEKCGLCKEFHNPNGICRVFPKWKNSDNFPSYNSLYNFYRAKEDIEKTGIVLIVESSSNVWRLKEANFPMSVGTFGSKFSETQKAILDTAQIHTIIVVPDAGLPGNILVKHVEEQCKFTHNIITISPNYKDDIGALNIETVKQIIGPYVDKYV